MATSSPLLSLVKTIFIPAVISLLLFLLLTFAVLPLWRRYRNRYSQYLPVPTYTSGLSNFLSRRLSMLTLPSTWSRNGGSVDSVDVDDFLDDGEELGSVDPRLVNVIRQVISRGDDHVRRLSRDLEEGFMDDSEDSDDDQTHA
ncbi:hypothetical protein E4U42_005229 [Claviceps africana]|uniref:Uncharacterized protein n=1 Tax=Claviceps africana TaxID=83212 RepID=A0A8K0J4H1_9HYPO|nr:hypothetical protein E4U42_005229 [Claviceps africana]